MDMRVFRQKSWLRVLLLAFLAACAHAKTAVTAVTVPPPPYLGREANDRASQWGARWRVPGAPPRLVVELGAGVRSAAFSPGGEIVVTVGDDDDGVAVLWDAASGLEIRRFALGKR